MKRLFLLLLLLATAANAAGKIDSKVATFMQTYGVNCHGEKKQKGDFRVDTLQISQTSADAENWQLVLDNLHLGEMPPEDEKQPKPDEAEQVTAWIQNELNRAASVLKGTGSETAAAPLEPLRV